MTIPLGQTVKRAQANSGRPFRIAGLTKVLGGISLFALLGHAGPAFSATPPAGPSVTLAWNQSPDPNAVGYDVYYGTASHTYTNMIHAGNVTNATISSLVTGVTYYFAATSYDAGGGQGGYSNEANYVVPPTLSALQIRSAPAGQFALTASGVAGHTYQVLATTDLLAWTVIGTVTLGTDGLLDFTDTNAAAFAQRFYRAQETP
jgi:hypothetical protein